jgi:HSP20 family molecular chaperone IbpA
MMTAELTTKSKQETADEQTRPERHYLPDVDIRENDDALYLWIDLPGVTADGLEVELDDGQLTIAGRVEAADYEGLVPVHTEYKVGPWIRRFNLPDASRFDAEQVIARLEHGVLEVTLPKAARAKPRKIAVAS